MSIRRSLSAQAVLAIVALLCVVAARGQAAQPVPRSDTEQIDVSADSLSVGEGGTQIEAKGNVEIKRQQATLKADEVRVNRETNDMEAKGKISLDDPEWKVKSADSMQFNLEKETGEIQNGDVFIEQGHVSISGQKFKKFTGQTYHIDEGFFTTCLCESGASPWRISAEEIDLELEGTGFIKNGYFYVYDIPVLYLPYGFFPLRSERQTGFLFPKVVSRTRTDFVTCSHFSGQCPKVRTRRSASMSKLGLA
jgi:LPS-assembly protein